MLDTAYKGNKDIMKTVAETIPDIVEEYCKLKDLQENVQAAEKDINELIKGMTVEEIKQAIKTETSKDKVDTDYLMRLSSELMRKEVANAKRGKEESADSI
jgi:hypothetical protein